MTIKPEYELEPLHLASFEAQSKWMLGMLARTIGVTKKQLRRVFQIIRDPNLEAEIVEKGKIVKRIFHHGFWAFSIKEKNKTRDILAPHPELQVIFEAIKDWLEKISSSHRKAFGCVKKRNPKKAARTLLGQAHFFSFDIADAFPSITAEMVEAALRRLKVNQAKVGEAVAKTLAWLVTYFYQNQKRLPQGSSCSPIILNLVYKTMCNEIDQICRERRLKWVVYVDDFTFAGESISQEVKDELLAVPARYGFQIKQEKTKDNLGKTVPHLLGLTIVDGEIHLRRRLKKKFRRMFYAARKFGAYSPECVGGIAGGAVKQIYGKEKNWPRQLSKAWQRYQTEKGV